MPDRRLHGSELLRASFVWIFSDGPGTTAEIQVGDIILALDGRLIKGKDFESAVAALKPGTQISVNYARGSASHEVQITVASQN